MSRPLRLKFKNQVAYYHINSSTVGKEYLLKRKEKNKLLSLITHYSEIYFIDILNFSIMDNHFHLFIRLNPETSFGDEEVKKRIRKYNKKRYENFIKSPTDSGIKKYRMKFSDLSDYVKDIKQRFSYWYNRRNNRVGYFWGDRFFSVLFEPGLSMLQCMAYIDLNPVRAGLATKAENYRWCGAYYRYRRKDRFLSFKGLYSNSMARSEQLLDYFSYLKGKEVELTETKHSHHPNSINTIYFSKGIAIGSYNFIKEVMDVFQIKSKKPVRHNEQSKELDLFTMKRCFP